MLKIVKSVFDIRKRNKGRLFIVLVSFLVSFLGARLYSLYIDVYVYIKGYHIHHFYFGTVALALGGILGILNDSNNKKRIFIASALIGIGMGLFADEIGLLLNSTGSTGFSAYSFPDIGDIILTIACVIVFLIAIADMDIKAFKQKCLSLSSALYWLKWNRRSRSKENIKKSVSYGRWQQQKKT